MVAPLKPKAEWPLVKAFCRELAREMAADDPARERTRARGPERLGRTGSDRALSVDRLSQRVHDPPDELLPHGDGDDPAGALDGVPLENVTIVDRSVTVSEEAFAENEGEGCPIIVGRIRPLERPELG